MTLRKDRSIGYRCAVKHAAAQLTYQRTSKGLRTQFRYQRKVDHGTT